MTGGASQSGGAGNAGGDAQSGGAGNAGGDAQSGGAGSGGAGGAAGTPTPDDVDLTLGGMNPDLADTPASCDERGVLGCLSLLGDFGGERFSATCQDSGGISGRVEGRYQLHCARDVTESAVTSFSLYLFLDEYLGEPTRLFSYESPVNQTPARGESVALLRLEPSGFESYSSDATPPTYEETIKIAGLHYTGSDDSERAVFGAFSATWTPTSACTDCPVVRIYARFNVMYEF